jgi:hypothetical protein
MSSTINSDVNQNLFIENIFYEAREQYQTSLEKKLNTLGYVPIVSCFSGFGRILYGLVYLVQDVANVVFLGIQSLSKGRSNKEGFKANRYLLYCIHDLFNIQRGLGEAIPFIGNIAWSIHDMIIPRFEYPSQCDFKIC